MDVGPAVADGVLRLCPFSNNVSVLSAERPPLIGHCQLGGCSWRLGQVSVAQLSKKVALPWRGGGGRHDHCGFGKLT